MLLNIVCFQLGWFACVLGAANQHPWLGVLMAIFLLAFHILRSKNSAIEIRLIVVAMIFGLLFDLIPLSLGWINFEPVAFWPSQLPPPWMICLWGLFASTFNISLNWLKSRFLIAFILGAVSGPLCYWAGYQLNALNLASFNYVMVYLMVGWALAVPFLLNLASSNELLKRLFFLVQREINVYSGALLTNAIATFTSGSVRLGCKFEN